MSLKEFSVSNANDYSRFGKPYPDYPSKKDPVECCLPGNFLNCPKEANLGNCMSFMTERCSKNFDDKCEIYANNITDVSTFKKFIRKTASKKFCELDPTSNCKKVCEPMFPIDQESPKFCEVVGKEAVLDGSKKMDIGVGEDVVISGVYRGNCMYNCDVVKPETIKNDDIVIDNCLRYGICNDILVNICDKSKDKTFDKFENKNLSEFCKLYKTNLDNLQAQKAQKTEMKSVLKSGKDKDVPVGVMQSGEKHNTSNISDKHTDKKFSSGSSNYSQPGEYRNNNNKTSLLDYLLFVVLIVLLMFVIHCLMKKSNKK